MTPEDFQRNINSAIDRTAEEMKPVMELAALSGKGMVALRVQNSGFGRQYTSRSYVKLRRKKGYEIRFVNLTFTGKMFQGWNVPNSERRGLIVRGVVGGSNIEVRNKLKWNKSRFPNFDKPNAEEKEIIKDFVRPKLKEILQQNLFKR